MSRLETKQQNDPNPSYAVEQMFLEKLQSKQQLVHIYLIGGIKMIGIIKAYDDFTILISAKSFGMQMLYKHAITTISCANQEEK